MTEKRRCALIVEDDADFASLIEVILKEQGFVTTVSFNGEDALDQARYRTPDLVTLDIEMPRKSGLFFYRKIKSDPAFRHVPVVVVTGVTRGNKEMETLIRAFLEVEHVPSPDAYIEKPFRTQELIDVVNQVCRPGSCESPHGLTGPRG